MNEAEVVFDRSEVRQGILALKPGMNLRTGVDNLGSAFGELTSLEKDLLLLASSVFACDLAFKRGERENIVRKIRLKLPVVNIAALQNVREEIVYALYLLSHDAWEIDFTPYQGTPEVTQMWVQENDSKVLLFSGGLDSFAEAMNLGHSGEQVHLVSHLTGNQNISKCQASLFEYLNKTFHGQFARTGVRVGALNRTTEGYPFPTDQAREETQRTRSFLFLTLAGIAARRTRTKDVIIIAENGQLAIHLPLTSARISAFSTHTAHPEFIESMTRILRAVLSFDIRINNPFLYMTKAEVVGTIQGAGKKMIPSTISCWMSARITGGRTHCGTCVPCIIRRIANEFNGNKIDEYNRDILSENIGTLDADDIGKRNFVEVAEFARFFHASNSPSRILSSYPELVSDAFDTRRAIDMYRRFSSEASQVFSAYPNLSGILA
jgi:7-cyano-7-deazaguanine synthase in queuosine biosynthesis